MKRFDQFRNPLNVRGFSVVLASTGQSVPVPPGMSILAALLGAGIHVPYNCGDGKCGVCEVRVLEGQPDHGRVRLSSGKGAGHGMVLTCCAVALGEELVLAL